jgi:hypothetical protein
MDRAGFHRLVLCPPSVYSASCVRMGHDKHAAAGMFVGPFSFKRGVALGRNYRPELNGALKRRSRRSFE